MTFSLHPGGIIQGETGGAFSRSKDDRQRIAIGFDGSEILQSLVEGSLEV